jgi:hypothetical protein
MPRSTSRRVGAGVLTRCRDGSCTFTCHHSGCHAYSQPRGWRAGLRQARQHAAGHDAVEARDVGIPWGVPTHELPRTSRRRWPLRRLATVLVVLALAALAFTLTLAGVTGHAAPAPRPTPAAPSIAILPTTTAAAVGPEGYVPTPAGPPAAAAGGTWIPEPDPSSAPTSASSSAGGGR